MTETAALAPGARAEFRIPHAGKESVVEVEVGRRPAPQRNAAVSRAP